MPNLLCTLAENLSGCLVRELREPEQGGGGRLAAIGSMYRWPAPIGATLADMAMVHKIMHGKGQLDHSCWFEKAADGQRATRNSADPLNLRVNHGRLEIRRNFFSVRVIESWNKIPSDLKSETKNVVFRSKYKTLRVLPMQPAAARMDL